MSRSTCQTVSTDCGLCEVDAFLSADTAPLTVELLVKELKDVTNWYIFGATLGVGCLYSLDWTTGLDYWTGLLDS